jgi:co-chaperonin GroES (HSP10)
MQYKKTFDNQVMIKLDLENKSIKLRNGFDLYIDTSFDPEKHMTVTGEVFGLPSKLYYSGEGNKGMPWKTDLELKFGDHVIIYYLSVMNAFQKEKRRYILKGEDRFVFIPYSSVFVKYGNGFIQPINGYCLIEPCENPEITREKNRMEALGMELIVGVQRNNTDVVYGIVRYTGTPNKEYVDEGQSDEGVDVKIGDTVVMKKISDIPLHYDLHAKIEQGKKLWRVQRRSILARI